MEVSEKFKTKVTLEADEERAAMLSSKFELP
jgi:hypothetical protein